ncbi:MAG: hypothetical protein JWL71_1424 [Acidobacteria bacterium]|nr:hypothetical protein [Acidobacteriota bacterium]
MAASKQQLVTDEWVTFPGGELEGQRPKVLCAACRDALKREAATYGALGGARRSRLLCFDCYRADLARARALKDAGDLDTASDARFQSQLPFEPVNHARLEGLKAARADAQSTASQGIGHYADKRRHAQIQARHALQTIAAGLKARQLTPAAQAQAMAAATHAAELQLPEAWLPYVVSR